MEFNADADADAEADVDIDIDVSFDVDASVPLDWHSAYYQEERKNKSRTTCKGAKP